MTDVAALKEMVSTRTPYHHIEVPFVVCWSQKSACTVIFKWFASLAGILDEAMQYGPKKPGRVNSIHKYEREVFKLTPGYKDELVVKLQSQMPVIHFVRCPFERAFSSYMHIHNPYFVEHPNWPSAGLEMRRKILGGLYGDAACIEYPISFQDYLFWLQQQDIQTLDPHHRPQYQPLFDAVAVEHFQLDDFAQVISMLQQRFNLPDSEHAEADIASSEHHVEKHALQKQATLEFLKRGVPLTRSDHFRAPVVSRDLLADTEMGAIIATLFARDLQLYDQLS